MKRKKKLDLDLEIEELGKAVIAGRYDVDSNTGKQCENPSGNCAAGEAKFG
jgi:hypothetical protein